MVAPATLSLRPCAGFPARQAERSSFPKTPSQLLSLPLSSLHLQRSKAHTNPKDSSLFLTKAISVDPAWPGSCLPSQQEGSRKYYFLVANAKFMLDEEEHFQEQLFERRRMYGERNKEQDFWLVVEPKFLDKFPNITNRLKRPAAALVSTDATWIRFMKLRLDRVLEDSFEANSLDEALAYDPVELQFDKPEKWVAPYPKYESGWWEIFMPPQTIKTAA